MAKTLSKTNILDGQLATAAQVTQSIDALTGDDGYDITISGSLTVTGSTDLNGNLAITGFPNVSASLAASGVGNGFPFTGSAGITGSLNIVGNITASGNISSSEDVIGDKFLSNNVQFARYDTTSNITFLGKTGVSTNILGPITASIISASGDLKAGKLFIDEKSAIDLYSGVGNELTLNPDATWDAIRLQRDGSPKPIILNGNVTASGNINASGNILGVTNITASGNISSSGHLAMNDIHATNFRLMDPLDVAAGPFSLIKATGALVASTGKIFIGDPDEADTGTHIIIDPPNENVIFKATDAIITGSLAITSQATHALLVLGNISSSGNLEGSNINATNAITASGHGLFQAGKPIITHTSHLSASISQAGFYNIVGGQFTCSITISSAPVGAEYEFFQTSSAGNFFFHTGSGITLISKNNSLRLAQQGSSAVLKKVATDTFHLMGDLT
tara:strand:+ start:88 stop:1437 length:1350 start_codon:yes stop_codon:yes gene_type:complete